MKFFIQLCYYYLPVTMYTFQDKTYSSMRDLINDMYYKIMALLKGGDYIWFNDTLLSIYIDCTESYEKPSEYEDDIEWKKTWKINSVKALELTTQTVDYVVSYNEYKEALSIFYGNEYEYDMELENKIGQILKDKNMLKRLDEMTDLVELNQFKFQEPDL